MTGALRVALVGLRGSGKSSVGRALAERAQAPFVDLDDELVVEAQRSGVARGDERTGELLARLGEPRFRALELAALADVASRPGAQVLATGGGVVETPAARELLRAAYTCVWLRAPLELLAARIEADPTPRPRLAGGSVLEELATLEERRSPHYRILASLVAEVEGRDPRAIAADLLEALFTERPDFPANDASQA